MIRSAVFALALVVVAIAINDRPAYSAPPSCALCIHRISRAAAPAPTPTDNIFAPDTTTGVADISVKGKLLQSFGGPLGGSGFIGMDNAGNVYDAIFQGSKFSFVRLSLGGSTPTATYTPTFTEPIGGIFAAPTGEVIVEGFDGIVPTDATEIWDVWDAGSPGGKPSRAIKHKIVSLPSNAGYVIDVALALANDGTIYLPYISPKTHKQQYDVIPPGSAKPSRTIVEAIAPAGAPFTPDDMAVAADGTLYATEWTFSTGDPNAGLYVYPASGPETRVTKGAPSPTGLDLDGLGNVYVANSSSTIGSSGYTPDATHLLSVFSPHATTLLRQVNKGFSNPQYLAVDDDGTAYLLDFATSEKHTELMAVIKPSAVMAKELFKPLAGSNLNLYNGVREKP